MGRSTSKRLRCWTAFNAVPSFYSHLDVNVQAIQKVFTSKTLPVLPPTCCLHTHPFFPWKVHKAKVPEQENTYDCGLFVLEYARRLLQVLTTES